MSALFYGLLILSLSFSLVASNSIRSYNVQDFGAINDGKTDSSRAFLSAWDVACNSRIQSQIYVPKGTYLVNRMRFEGGCKNYVTLYIDGMLVAPRVSGIIAQAGHWILFHGVDGLRIYGGILDARGQFLWSCRSSGRCQSGAKTLDFENCNNILIQNTRSLNSQMYHLAFNGCEHVRVESVRLIADGNSPNTDGIHTQKSTDIAIVGSIIKTGDDCISIGQGTTNVLIHDIFCGPGHGISIGSLGQEEKEDGVRNITARRITFSNTDNGFRIKSWAKPSNGFVEDILFEDSTMDNVRNPIIIDQNYCPQQNCPKGESGIRIRDVRYNNIKGRSESFVAVKLDCSPKNPCTQLRLQDIKLTYQPGGAIAECQNTRGAAVGLVQPNCL